MALARWDPWSELAALQRDVHELFGRTTPAGRRPAGLVPAMDAYDTDDSLVIRLELPGMSPEQVEVNFDHGVLTVSGERSTDTEVAEDRWLRRERALGTFSRSITLPDGVAAEQITANFDNGLLELRIPHAPQQRAQRIPVRAASQSQTVDVTGHATQQQA